MLLFNSLSGLVFSIIIIYILIIYSFRFLVFTI